ncbi:speckle-type POZ protein B-like [Planococcus citri]|uniref:speckle-type POZ protein B-like n=1 Tax=Planococcus citri TaxID=170843 RepID=UPI0031F964ED
MNSVNLWTVFLIFIFDLSKCFCEWTRSDDITANKVHCNSTVLVHKVHFVWTITNMDFLKVGGENVVDSPKFSSPTNPKIKWLLRFTPRPKDFDLQLHMVSECEEKTVLAKARVAMLDDDGNVICCGEKELGPFQDSLTTDFRKGWICIHRKIRKMNLLCNVLKIQCNITFSEPNATLVKHEHNALFDQFNAPSELKRDLGYLLKNYTYSDVVVLVNDKSFPAHKAILAVRSNILAGMLQATERTPEHKHRIIIRDLKEEVVNEMLRYIYVGECQNLERLAKELLVAACKYELEGLKRICVQALSQALTVDNVSEILIFADNWNVAELKAKTVRFVASRYTEISNTDGWKTVINSSPHLVHEVCQEIATNQNSS